MTVPFEDLRAATEDVRAAVEQSWLALLDGDQFVGGASVERFEAAWADYCGTSDAVGVGNGTDALHLTLRALEVRSGDDVVVPANADTSVVEAVLLTGAVPRFADVDPRTLLLDRACFEAAATPRTVAVIVVHLYGQMPDVDAINESAVQSGIAVVEDATHAPGATWRGRRAGSVSRAGCFGFEPDANLGGLGDAGAVVTSDPVLADTVRALRDHGRGPGTGEHQLVGFSSRMDSVQADVLTAKLTHLDGWAATRRTVAQRYRDAVGPERITFLETPDGSTGAQFLIVVRVARRDRVRTMFTSLGIGTRVHYAVPLHLTPPFAAYRVESLPAVEQAARDVITLPSSAHLTDEQVERVCRALESVDAMLAVEDALGSTP